MVPWVRSLIPKSIPKWRATLTLVLECYATPAIITVLEMGGQEGTGMLTLEVIVFYNYCPIPCPASFCRSPVPGKQLAFWNSITYVPTIQYEAK
jgi:hypothetical protein